MYRVPPTAPLDVDRWHAYVFFRCSFEANAPNVCLYTPSNPPSLNNLVPWLILPMAASGSELLVLTAPPHKPPIQSIQRRKIQAISQKCHLEGKQAGFQKLPAPAQTPKPINTTKKNPSKLSKMPFGRKAGRLTVTPEAACHALGLLPQLAQIPHGTS
jgi:hypothetical protein